MRRPSCTAAARRYGSEVWMIIRRAARARRSRGSRRRGDGPRARHTACRFPKFARRGCARSDRAAPRCRRSSAARWTAAVRVSPFAAASSRTAFSNAGSLMLSGIAILAEFSAGKDTRIIALAKRLGGIPPPLGDTPTSMISILGYFLFINAYKQHFGQLNGVKVLFSLQQF